MSIGDVPGIWLFFAGKGRSGQRRGLGSPFALVELLWSSRLVALLEVFSLLFLTLEVKMTSLLSGLTAVEAVASVVLSRPVAGVQCFVGVFRLCQFGMMCAIGIFRGGRQEGGRKLAGGSEALARLEAVAVLGVQG